MFRISADQFFRLAPPGSAMCASVQINEKIYTTLFIKSYEDWDINKKMYIKIRFALFDYKIAAPVVLMAKIFKDIFETYINWADDDQRALLYNLTKQTEIPILIYRKTDIARKLLIKNEISKHAADFIEYLGDRRWTDRDFKLSRNMIENNYGDIQSLWENLGKLQDNSLGK